jgi:predicted amidohydrolase YtcJ
VPRAFAFRSPDTILRSARVQSLADGPIGSQRPKAVLPTALAIQSGRIVAVGSDSEVTELAGPTTRVFDMAGRSILPSFVDSHTHFHRAAVLRRLFLDFEALAPRSIDDVVEAVRKRAAEAPADAWIQGDSLSAAQLVEGHLPDRWALDRAAGGRPVVLRGIGKHVIAASSAALAAAGIDKATPDPPGGRIERDSDGEPTGILHERAKLRLDSSDARTVIPTVAPEVRRAAVRDSVADLHRLGITTIHEMIRLPEEADDLMALRMAGELAVRVRLFYRVHETPIRLEDLATLGIRAGLGDDWLRILGVKISVDGWCIFANAAVYEPYCDQPDNLGLMRIEPEELTRLTVAANERELAVAIHAVGARAVDAALDAFAAAGPARRAPYRLEHGHLDMDQARLQRMGDLDVTWSVQPGFLTAYRPDWEHVLQPDRVERILPLRSALELGIPTLHNSDVPSGPQAPLAAIRAAVSRLSGGRPLGISEAVPLEVAWRGWTTLGSRAAGETTIGSLEPGHAADLVVFDSDPFASTMQELVSLDVAATMIDGRFVYGADGVSG